MVGVDDLLVLPGAPGMRAGGREQRVPIGGEAKEPRACLALALGRVGEGVPPPGADLDLRLDQLARHRFRKARIRVGRLPQLLEAVVERERVRIQDRELLLDPDREVR
jgi:hypothetical protein